MPTGLGRAFRRVLTLTRSPKSPDRPSQSCSSTQESHMDSRPFSRDLLPPDEGIYPDKKSAIDALKDHAKAHGYAVGITRSYGLKNAQLHCSKWKKNVSRIPEDRKKRNRKGHGTECPWKVVIYAVKGEDITVRVKVVNASHNHPAFQSLDEHHAYRQLPEEVLSSIASQVSQGVTATTIMTQHHHEHSGFVRKDYQNAIQKARRELLEGNIPVQVGPSQTPS